MLLKNTKTTRLGSFCLTVKAKYATVYLFFFFGKIL
jgi:hypothetical protein